MLTAALGFNESFRSPGQSHLTAGSPGWVKGRLRPLSFTLYLDSLRRILKAILGGFKPESQTRWQDRGKSPCPHGVRHTWQVTVKWVTFCHHDPGYTGDKHFACDVISFEQFPKKISVFFWKFFYFRFLLSRLHLQHCCCKHKFSLEVKTVSCFLSMHLFFFDFCWYRF